MWIPGEAATVGADGSEAAAEVRLWVTPGRAARPVVVLLVEPAERVRAARLDQGVRNSPAAQISAVDRADARARRSATAARRRPARQQRRRRSDRRRPPHAPPLGKNKRDISRRSTSQTLPTVNCQ